MISEFTPLEAKILLALLNDPAVRAAAVQHYATGPLDKLIAALETIRAGSKP